MGKITVNNLEIRVIGIEKDDYVRLTDLAKLLNQADPRYLIQTG